MSWDQKPKGRSYYYRNQRVDGMPVKVYVGTGRAGELAETEDREARVRRNADQYHWFCILSQIDELSEPVTQLSAFSKLMTRVVMVANGLYLHRRHEWRVRQRVKL